MAENIKFVGNHAVSRVDGVVFALEPGTRTGPLATRSNTPGPNEPEPGSVSSDGKHSAPVAKVNFSGSLYNVPFAPWGANNLRPDDIAAETKLSGIALAGLDVRKNAHYSDGPFYFKQGIVNGKQQVVSLSSADAELKDIWPWHEKTIIDPLYYDPAILDCEWWGRVVTEYVITPDASNVASYRCLRNAWCRYSLMNEYGRIEWLLFNPNWKMGDTSAAELIPVADPWWTPEEVRAWCKANGFRKFVRCVGVTDPTDAYYPSLAWHANYDNGWLQQTNAIPKLKDAAMTQQVNWKWHVRIPYSYWEKRFEKEWADWKQEERDAAMKSVLDNVIKVFSGAENAGKVIFSGFGQSEDGRAYPGWEITALDDKLKDGQYIPDADKGNSEILATMGVDWTLLGQGGGASQGAGGGSGSDKREAWTILTAQMQRNRSFTTDAWYFTRDFNKWPSNVQTGFRQITLTSLDINPTGREAVAQP